MICPSTNWQNCFQPEENLSEWKLASCKWKSCPLADLHALVHQGWDNLWLFFFVSHRHQRCTLTGGSVGGGIYCQGTSFEYHNHHYQDMQPRLWWLTGSSGGLSPWCMKMSALWSVWTTSAREPGQCILFIGFGMSHWLKSNWRYCLMLTVPTLAMLSLRRLHSTFRIASFGGTVFTRSSKESFLPRVFLKIFWRSFWPTEKFSTTPQKKSNKL